VEAHDSSAVLGREEAQRQGLAHLVSLSQPYPAAIPLPRAVPEFAPATAPVPRVRLPSAPHPAPARQARPRWRRWASMAARAAVAAGVLAGTVWAAAVWPAGRWLVYAAWMMPLAELGLLAAGQAQWRWRWRQAPAGRFRLLIIQITTEGREHARVEEIISQIRGAHLSMLFEVWVVTEPADRGGYPLADAVLTVPPWFRCRAGRKGRALEWSRLARQKMGLDCGDVKILFVDDDVSLTPAYIERAYRGGYDICQGVITPRTSYAGRPLGHFAASHADDIRTHACLVYCSVFQGILGRPLHVHGEGLAVTGAAEARVGWDVPLVASEDLSFGQRAAKVRGLSWGWFHEYAEVTSPWTVREFLVQRRRWLWGDIHAITHRQVMPSAAAVRVAAKYAAGTFGLVCSAVGLWLRVTGRIPAGAGVLGWAKLSVLAWVGLFFACGWIGASAAHGTRRADDSRLLAGVTAVVMMPVSVALTFAAIAVPWVLGDSGTFQTITKTRGGGRP
jgi:Glycosyl transferase family group 2